MKRIKKYVIIILAIGPFLSMQPAHLHPSLKKTQESLKKTVSYLKKKYSQQDQQKIAKGALILTAIIFIPSAAYMICRCSKKPPPQDKLPLQDKKFFQELEDKLEERKKKGLFEDLEEKKRERAQQGEDTEKNRCLKPEDRAINGENKKNDMFYRLRKGYEKALNEGNLSQEQYDRLVAQAKKRANIKDEQENLTPEQVQEKIYAAQKQLAVAVNTIDETLVIEAITKGAKPHPPLLHTMIQKIADDTTLLENEETRSSVLCIIWQLAYKTKFSKESYTVVVKLSHKDLHTLETLNDRDPEKPFTDLIERARKNR